MARASRCSPTSTISPSSAGAQPGDDIVSEVANGAVDGRALPPVELLSYLFLLVVAGNETTRNAMTGGMLALLEHPGEWKRLADERGARRRPRSRRSCAGRRP